MRSSDLACHLDYPQQRHRLDFHSYQCARAHGHEQALWRARGHLCLALGSREWTHAEEAKKTRARPYKAAKGNLQFLGGGTAKPADRSRFKEGWRVLLERVVTCPRYEKPTCNERQAKQWTPEQQQANKGNAVGQVMYVPVGTVLMRLLVVAEECGEFQFGLAFGRVARVRHLTFDISGRRRAQPFDCPLDGRVRRRVCHRDKAGCHHS